MVPPMSIPFSDRRGRSLLLEIQVCRFYDPVLELAVSASERSRYSHRSTTTFFSV
jgi:hypothetical protein